MEKAQKRLIKNLKSLLEMNKKSMDKVGLESNFSKGTLSKIISGKMNPSLETLEKIAEYFEIDITDLFK